MIDDDTPDMPLDDTQTARAAALAFARSALGDSNSSPITSQEALPKRFGTQDLIDVAQWVLEGTDPLEGYRESHRTITVVRVPDDQVEAVSALNQVPSEDFPGGLLIVPESVSSSSISRVRFPVADPAGSSAGCA